jgi:hypothetical protein
MLFALQKYQITCFSKIDYSILYESTVALKFVALQLHAYVFVTLVSDFKIISQYW